MSFKNLKAKVSGHKRTCPLKEVDLTTSNPNLVDTQTYRLWRLRMMVFMMLGYAAFYFVRSNLSFALPYMEVELGFTKKELGRIVSTFGVVYGFGKFISGVIGDRTSARMFMAAGLALSALANICMGFTTSLGMLIGIWALNSCFQSAGAPACAKMLTHWFSPKELGTHWAIWSTSQQMGAALVGTLIAHYFLAWGGWRYAFFVPGVISLIIAGLVYWGVRDEPERVGLPSPEQVQAAQTQHVIEDECAHMTTFQVLVTRVLRNKMVWAMCLASFFMYFVRMTFLFWGPTFLCEAKGNDLGGSAGLMAAFQVAGVAGSILAGVLSDRLFRGYRGRAGLFYMCGLMIAVFGIWRLPSESPHTLHILMMFLVGFFVAGPQTMIGVAAVDFASKRAAGAASGLTGTCGYMGTALSGILPAYIAIQYGWHWVFAALVASALAGTCCFLFTWNARAKSLEEAAEGESSKGEISPIKIEDAAESKEAEDAADEGPDPSRNA